MLLFHIAVLKSFHDILFSFWLYESNKILLNKKIDKEELTGFRERMRRLSKRMLFASSAMKWCFESAARTIDEIFHKIPFGNWPRIESENTSHRRKCIFRFVAQVLKMLTILRAEVWTDEIARSLGNLESRYQPGLTDTNGEILCGIRWRRGDPMLHVQIHAKRFERYRRSFCRVQRQMQTAQHFVAFW